MLNNIIKQKTDTWLRSDDCKIKSQIGYIRNKGNLRDTQVSAIETYLFLKIEGQNKPLWKLFSEGFFINGTELSKLNINETTRKYLVDNKDAFALYDFACQKNGNNIFLPELEKIILNDPSKLDYEGIIKSIFYNVNYADYLMSLPMGAGKTFLMAAFIYLDLYFAENEPENKVFAHNFLVMIPSGLKSSIVPSIKTIENFDPSWVLPEPSASNLKKILKFEILDEQKSAKKSNRARNPNAQKISQCLPNPFGQVFVVNAEKVILNRLELGDQLELIEKTEDEQDRFANELRHLVGKIPNLTIMIDEVHHAATDDIKLRQVVNKWNGKGNITTVLGFSGTPYLPNADKLNVTEDAFFKFSQITNTVYYYPLTTAIRYFLKKPKVKIGINLDRFEIIKQGITDFQKLYKRKIYDDGTIAKISIYCSNIEILENEVYPYLTGELKIKPKEILKYHKGNKEFKIPPENEREFRSLDLPLSKKRYVLLVQVGKEGWDCRSLTGIILSQKGDSPKNMVLQTSCRCLRQVDKNKDETALIWLNEFNAKTLNDQLKKEQQTSIEEINNIKKGKNEEGVERYSRIEHLQLPQVDFYQLKVTYQAIEEEKKIETKKRLKSIIDIIDNFKTSAIVKSSSIDNIDSGTTNIIDEIGFDVANYNQWIFDISKESFNKITSENLHVFDKELTQIFNVITHEKNKILFYNELYDLYQINSKIRLAFSIRRQLKTDSEIVPEKAELLIASHLDSVEKNSKLYPSQEDVGKILKMDKDKGKTEIDATKLKADYEKAKKTLTEQGLEKMLPPFEEFIKKDNFSLAVKNKEKTFHYLPYDFKQSGFEKEILQQCLTLSDFTKKNLEIYYNGERGLTEFVINCFARENEHWKNIGKYTTDFLIIQREKNKKIHKVLIVETKGKGFSNDPVFQKKRKFVETDFLKQNNDKFNYKRFDFLYLEDSDDTNKNIIKLSDKINELFGE
jgi:type III restriction enzyme